MIDLTSWVPVCVRIFVSMYVCMHSIWATGPAKSTRLWWSISRGEYLCVWMYICMYAVQETIRTYMHTYVHTHIYIYPFCTGSASTPFKKPSVHTYTQTYIHISHRLSIYAIRTYIHVYIHTCIHTYIPSKKPSMKKYIHTYPFRIGSASKTIRTHIHVYMHTYIPISHGLGVHAIQEAIWNSISLQWSPRREPECPGSGSDLGIAPACGVSIYICVCVCVCLYMHAYIWKPRAGAWTPSFRERSRDHSCVLCENICVCVCTCMHMYGSLSFCHSQYTCIISDTFYLSISVRDP
jgi:hypothetical protein